ncbi:hypothetical protein R3P38DRAFT_2766426 [Favolaschia claudopus]|uniref:Uncharacterized protein n=1 Tax=Favolaschia claudopus TaxID=2862362 RepID=A0AAW0D0H4_9AGAR
MFSFPWSSRPPTPPPEGMRCIPCSGQDLVVRDLVVTTGFIINMRLDAKALEQSLTKLVQNRFPRAGARLALRNGVYEFQVPLTFDSTTRPIAFTVEDFAEPYAQAGDRPPLPTNLAADLSEPFVCATPPLHGYFKSSTCPSALEGFLVPNTPLTHLHVALFDDITFIGITSTHIAFDALGTSTLLHAWTRLLNGETIDAIPGMDWDAAPFEAFQKPTTVTHQRGWFNLGLFGQLFFIVLFVWGLIRDPKEEQRIVRVPKSFLEERKREIMEELKSQGSSEYVGSSDILLAWWFKTLCSVRKTGDSTLVHIHMPINLREKRIFPGDSIMGTPYINNSVAAIAIPPIPIRAFQTASLGELALRIRCAVLAYNADIEGIKQDVHWRFMNPFVEHFPCPPGAEYTFQTNWRSAKFGDLDFSGARASRSAVEKGVDEAKVRTRVLLAVGYALSTKQLPMRGAGGMFMEDDDAVWTFQIRGQKEWAKIRRSGRVAFV